MPHCRGGRCAGLGWPLDFVALRMGLLAPDQVTLARVSSGALSPSVFGKCMIEARRRCMVGPMAAGRFLVPKFDVGDVVKAGQLLAEKEPVDLVQLV